MFSKLINSNNIFSFIIGLGFFLAGFLLIELFIVYSQHIIALEKLEKLGNLVNQVLSQNENLIDQESLGKNIEEQKNHSMISGFFFGVIFMAVLRHFFTPGV